MRSGEQSVTPTLEALKVSRPCPVHSMYERLGQWAGICASAFRSQVRRDIWELGYVMRGWPVGRKSSLG